MLEKLEDSLIQNCGNLKMIDLGGNQLKNFGGFFRNLDDPELEISFKNNLVEYLTGI